MPIEDTKENRTSCVCPKCPSYPHDCKGELLYCAKGRSNCDIKIAGCICSMCPVWYKYKLDALYFCDKESPGDDGGSKVFMRKKRPGEGEMFYRAVADIRQISASGKSIVCSMGSQKAMPFSFDDIHFVPAQVSRIPLNKEEEVTTEVFIGPKAKKPMHVLSPIMISGMSFGAVSKNVRSAISRTAAKLGVGFNSGEGGILDDELSRASKYMIGQYATGRFGVDDAHLKKVAAVEIRFGQGAYPGKGSYLPADKITPEIAKARGLREGEAAYSPAHHPDMATPMQIKEKVSWLRKIAGGVPVGAKIGCGNVELDIEVLVDAGVDFIALDGFGAGTGATDFYVRENVGIPILAALPRAQRYLKRIGARDKITLIAGGSLRTSADFAKCLALGADAVYIGTAALIAINCEQYRICHTGLCPTGVTTHDPVLVKQIDVEKAVERLSNFISVSTHEIAGFARIAGKDSIAKLGADDLVSMKRSLAAITGIRWVSGELIN